MSDQPNDAVTNTADLMINYTDDEIKAEVWAHIRVIVQEVVRFELDSALSRSDTAERFIVNNAYVFNKQVMRAVKDYFANQTNNIY